MQKREYDWSRDLRFILDRVDDVPDPIDRLRFLVEIRQALSEVLTTAYERACWDARVADRDDEALAVGVSAAAFRDYSRRWNGRLEGAARIRWSDPLHIKRREKVVNLTEVAKGNSPESIRTGWREVQRDAPEDRDGAQ